MSDNVEYIGQIAEAMGMIPKDSVSLRDQFAMAALTAIDSEDVSNQMLRLGKANIPLEHIIAGIAYRYADAMLAERKKCPK